MFERLTQNPKEARGKSSNGIWLQNSQNIVYSTKPPTPHSVKAAKSSESNIENLFLWKKQKDRLLETQRINQRIVEQTNIANNQQSTPRINPQSSQLVSYSRNKSEKIEDKLLRQGEAKRKRLQQKINNEAAVREQERNQLLASAKPPRATKHQKQRHRQKQNKLNKSDNQNITPEYLATLSHSQERQKVTQWYSNRAHNQVTHSTSTVNNADLSFSRITEKQTSSSQNLNNMSMNSHNKMFSTFEPPAHNNHPDNNKFGYKFQHTASFGSSGKKSQIECNEETVQMNSPPSRVPKPIFNAKSDKYKIPPHSNKFSVDRAAVNE